MKTRTTITLLSLVAACATETSPSVDPPAAEPNAAVAQKPDAVETEPGPEPEPEPAAAPELKPIAPEVAPKVSPMVWGECRRPGVTTIDDQVFAHYMVYNQKRSGGYDGVIHRMGADGSIAEELRYDVAPQVRLEEGHKFRPPPQRLRQLGGRWPDELFAVVDYSARDYEGSRIARWKDGAWDVVKLFGHDAQWAAVWPWHEGSTLALLRQWKNGNQHPRMAVVRGAGKGPSLKLLRRKAGCDPEQLDFTDIHVSPAGPIWGLVQCKGTWMVGWTPEDREGRLVSLSKQRSQGELELDDNGNGYIGLHGGNSGGLYTWKDGVATQTEAPGNAPRDLAIDANGALWLTDQGKVYRQGNDGWQDEIGDVASLSGVEGSSPIVHLRDKGLQARIADGTWHPMELSQPDPKGEELEVLDVVVPASGDVWVAAKYRRYFKGKKVLRKFGAIYTQRPVTKPMKCK